MGSALSELSLGEIAKPSLMHTRRFQQLLPFTPLLLLPLLLWKFFDVDQQSLLPWDEGLYMLRARLFLDQSEAWVPFAQAHHKTPGHYWIVALSMRLFGVSDIAARLPFVLLALLSAWIVYEIGSLVLSRRTGAMASLILGTSYLWAVHSRTISPNMAYISFFLGGVLLLVQELVKPSPSSGQFSRWRLVFVGILFALTIFLRSALAFLPLVGLMPWLLKQVRGRKILMSPWLWLGLACGCLPTLIWVWKSITVYGITGFMAPLMFPLGKVTGKGLGFPFSSFPYYFGSLFFLHFIPWSPLLPFALTSPNLWDDQGCKSLWSTHRFHRRWLLFATPTIMLLFLAFTSSQHKHYALPIYPFAALLIAADLEYRLTELSTTKTFRGRRSYRVRWKSLRHIAAIHCGLACVILIFCFSDGLPMVKDIDMTFISMKRLYVILILLGSVWLLGSLMVYWPYRNFQQSLKSWIICHLFGAYLVIFVTIHLGFVGNYSSEVKAFLSQPDLQDVLSTGPVDVVTNGRVKRMNTLLRVYSPIIGKSWSSFNEFKALGSSLAWIYESDLTELDFPYRILAQDYEVLLIHVQSYGHQEKSPLPRLEKPAGLGNPSPGLTFSW